MTSERPGDRIKALRTQQKLTQEQLAKKAGISIGFLSDVETGTSNIGANKLLDLADALDVTLDYLMKGEELPTTSKPAPLELPAALVKTAEKFKLTVGQARRLLGIQQQIIGFRNDERGTDLESVDWDKLYALVNKDL